MENNGDMREVGDTFYDNVRVRQKQGVCSTSRVSEYTNITVTVSYRNNNRSRGHCYLYPTLHQLAV